MIEKSLSWNGGKASRQFRFVIESGLEFQEWIRGQMVIVKMMVSDAWNHILDAVEQKILLKSEEQGENSLVHTRCLGKLESGWSPFSQWFVL